MLIRQCLMRVENRMCCFTRRGHLIQNEGNSQIGEKEGEEEEEEEETRGHFWGAKGTNRYIDSQQEDTMNQV